MSETSATTRRGPKPITYSAEEIAAIQAKPANALSAAELRKLQKYLNDNAAPASKPRVLAEQVTALRETARANLGVTVNFIRALHARDAGRDALMAATEATLEKKRVPLRIGRGGAETTMQEKHVPPAIHDGVHAAEAFVNEFKGADGSFAYPEMIGYTIDDSTLLAITAGNSSRSLVNALVSTGFLEPQYSADSTADKQRKTGKYSFTGTMPTVADFAELRRRERATPAEAPEAE